MGAFFAIVLSLLAIFLILLVLVQRGRGGGLAGALGGVGGSSAFGAKAGDVFTRITIVTATIWILVSLMAVYWANHRADALGTAGPGALGTPPLEAVPPAAPADNADRQPAGPPPVATEAPPAEASRNESAPPASENKN